MNAKRSYHYLRSLTMDGCDLTRAAEAEAKRTWQCAGGVHPKPDVGAIDVHLEQSSIKDGPLNSVSASVGLARRSFLEQLGEDVIERDLYIGKVFNNRGRLLEDWMTFRARRHVIVRGYDERAGPDYPEYRPDYRSCHLCGRVLYGALRNKHHYLYPAPPDDAEIFGEGCTRLVIPAHLFVRLEIPKKAKIAVDRLEVLDEPLDGFGVLEPWEPDRSKWGDRHRTMRGCTRLTDEVLRKGVEDTKARNRGSYRRIFWHFFPDAETGRIEIAPDLRQAMERSGIECVFHE